MFVYRKTLNELVIGDKRMLPLWDPFLPCPLALSDNISSKSISKHSPTPPLAEMAICCHYHQQTFSDLPTSALSFSAFHLILFNVLPLPWALVGPPLPTASSGVDKVQLQLWCSWQLSFCLHTSQALREAIYHNTPCLFSFIWSSSKSLPNH